MCVYDAVCRSFCVKKFLPGKKLCKNYWAIVIWDSHSMTIMCSCKDRLAKVQKTKNVEQKKEQNPAERSRQSKKTREIGLKKAKWLSRIQILRCCTSYNISNIPSWAFPLRNRTTRVVPKFFLGVEKWFLQLLRV